MFESINESQLFEQGITLRQLLVKERFFRKSQEARKSVLQHFLASVGVDCVNPTPHVLKTLSIASGNAPWANYVLLLASPALYAKTTITSQFATDKWEIVRRYPVGVESLENVEDVYKVWTLMFKGWFDAKWRAITNTYADAISQVREMNNFLAPLKVVIAGNVTLSTIFNNKVREIDGLGSVEVYDEDAIAVTSETPNFGELLRAAALRNETETETAIESEEDEFNRNNDTPEANA